MDISTRQYLAIVAAFFTIPMLFDLAYLITSIRAGEVMIKDVSVAAILDLNSTAFIASISFLRFTPNGVSFQVSSDSILLIQIDTTLFIKNM